MEFLFYSVEYNMPRERDLSADAGNKLFCW